ncbi:MAG: thiamine phosphate synthase [Dehalococcoidia bacterium]
MANPVPHSPFPARLLVVADLDYVGDEARWLALIGEVAAAAAGRPVAIQVRAKHAEGPEASALAARARAAVPDNVPALLNGSIAVAERLGYAGVHWPEADVPRARPPHPIAFRSAAAHSVEAVRRAEAAGADVVVFGAVWTPGSHPGDGAGAEALRAAVAATALPVFAIGGVTPERAGECLRAGAAGVAVVSGILGASDVRAAIDEYLAAIEAATEGTAA